MRLAIASANDAAGADDTPKLKFNWFACSKHKSQLRATAAAAAAATTSRARPHITTITTTITTAIATAIAKLILCARLCSIPCTRFSETRPDDVSMRYRQHVFPPHTTTRASYPTIFLLHAAAGDDVTSAGGSADCNSHQLQPFSLALSSHPCTADISHCGDEAAQAILVRMRP
jgi:hypothetical protein